MERVGVDRRASWVGSIPARARVVREGLGLYLWLLGAQVRSQLQYRASFALQFVGQGLATFVDFIAILLLFGRFPTLAGWSLGEVAFLYGLGGIAFALSDLFSGGFDRLSFTIQTGQFDRVLTRPVSVFLQTLSMDFQIRRLGRVAQAAVAFVFSLTLVQIEWTPLRLLVMVIALISGVVIFCGIWVIGAAITFWTVQTSEVTNVFTYGGSALVEHPMSIYGRWLQRFFTFVVPLAFVTYLPALYILDRPDPLGLPGVLRFCSPLVAAAFYLLARAIWSFGVRHYQSTGS
ncbi:MAG: ABC transporter permease [Dehalococcoidia bacterium]